MKIPRSELAYTVNGVEYCGCDKKAVYRGRCPSCNRWAMEGFRIRLQNPDRFCPKCLIYGRTPKGLCTRCLYLLRAENGKRGELDTGGILELHQDGWTVRAIATEYSASYSTIRNILKRSGAKMPERPMGQQPKPLPIDEIIERYEAGDSTVEIAAVYGVTHQTIRTRLIEAGIQIRTRAEAARLRCAKRK